MILQIKMTRDWFTPSFQVVKSISLTMNLTVSLIINGQSLFYSDISFSQGGIYKVSLIKEERKEIFARSDTNQPHGISFLNGFLVFSDSSTHHII